MHLLQKLCEPIVLVFEFIDELRVQCLVVGSQGEGITVGVHCGQVIKIISQFHKMNSNLSRAGQNTLYKTTNQDYGSAWVHENVRPEHLDLKTAKVPTYSQVVDSMSDFKKAERLIKSRIINEKYAQSAGHTPNQTQQSFAKRTEREFPIKHEQYKYPEHGLNVGPIIYRTNNMNYGSELPTEMEIPNKYLPCDSSFTKGFTGGNFKFNGLNTAKTLSTVHNNLNEM